MHPPRQDDAETWSFDWDHGNVDELGAHGVLPYEAEQVFLNGPRWFRNKKDGAGDYRIVGWTDGGRALTIIVALREGHVVRVVTGWPT